VPILAFPLELKSLSAEGEFEGLASTYGNVDQGGDVVEEGAFTETLKQAGAARPLLCDHRDVVGMVTLKDTPKGLACKGKLTLGVQKARETYELMRDGAIKGLSIGYSALGGGDIRNGVRYLSQVKLYEVSLTWAPMNEMALVTGMKSVQEQQVKNALQEFRSDLKTFFDKRGF